MTLFAKRSSLALVLIGALIGSTSAFAAGFEKAQTWNAKAAAMGGAVVGSTSGAESLYFNPAGLENSNSSGEVSLNFSPTFSKFSGTNPYSQQGSIDGKGNFSPVGGLLASFKPTPKLGVGAGYYVSGGTIAKYENLNYMGSSPLSSQFDTISPTVETDLAITETALGLGYEVLPGLRIGAAWRVVHIAAKFSTVALTPNAAIANVTVDNISATRWNAYKLGAQYEEPNHRWGLGADFRSSVKFTAKGDTSGNYETAAPGTGTNSLGTGSADLDNAFPLQFALGGWTRASELLKIGYEYSYTNYNQDKALDIRGSVSGAAGTTTLSSIPQHWKNMHIGRIGAEYTGYAMPIRIGYAYTSQVTPTDYARSTFASPGPGHSFTAGSGMTFGGNIDFDYAFEYSFASGTGHNQNAPLGVAEVANDAQFKSHVYVAHLDAKYRF
jgi:long-chain fatty acid transport protein